MTRGEPRLPQALLWLALAAICAATVGPAYMNHDAAWYLYMVDRWRAGATLYRDVIDTNPPLIVWISAPPALLARGLGVTAPALFKAYVFTVSIWTCAFSCRIVSRRWPARVFPLVTTIVFVCLPFVKQDFGQREHFALLLTLPYILMAGSPAPFSAAEGWTAGIAAGIGFAIKPHFVAAWVLLEAVAIALAGARRIRSIPVVAVLCTFGLYAGAVMAMTPQYFEVAAQVREVYGGLNTPVAALLRLKDVQVWIAAAAIVALVRWRRDDPLVVAVFVAATGFLAAALLQLKGWSYHLYPARALLILFFVGAVVVLFERAPDVAALLRGGRRGLAVMLGVIALATSARYFFEARHPVAPDLVEPLIAAIREKAPEGPVAVLSTAMFVYPAFPAVNYTRAAWPLRQNSLVFLTALYGQQPARPENGAAHAFHTTTEMGRTEATLFQQLVDDLCREPPRLLLVDAMDRESRSTRRTFDVLAYLRQDPRLTTLLSRYRADGQIGPLAVWSSDSTAACR